MRSRLALSAALLMLAGLAGIYGASLRYEHPDPVWPDHIADPLEVALLTAADLGVPSGWVLETAWRESHLDQSAIGAAGECGTFQLHPLWGVCDDSPRYQAWFAVKFLAQLKAQYKTWGAVRFHYTHG